MRKIIPVVAAGATVLALAGGTFAYANLDKNVTLSVDGATQQVSTLSSTVGDVLKSEKITLSDHDVVAPALGTKITDGTQIAVQYGRQVRVRVDGLEQAYWTTATKVDQALAALNIAANGAALSTSRSAPIGRQGLSVNVATLKTVTVNAAGAKRQVKTTAQTVGDVLKAAKITVDANDLLSLKPSTRITNGTLLTFTRVDAAQVTKKKKVAYDTVRRHTKKLTKGVTKIDTAGKAGTRTLTYTVVRHNGKIVSTKKTGSKITRQPRTQVILVGTKVRVHKSSGGSSSGGSSSGAPQVASGGVWDRIAACESGGNWSINTGNGFYGGLQFTLSTWHANGGSGMPNHASRSAQIAVAKRVQASQGWGAWPACTSKLGIR